MNHSATWSKYTDFNIDSDQYHLFIIERIQIVLILSFCYFLYTSAPVLFLSAISELFFASDARGAVSPTLFRASKGCIRLGRNPLSTVRRHHVPGFRQDVRHQGSSVFRRAVDIQERSHFG